jgi:hypothetical protein
VANYADDLPAMFDDRPFPFKPVLLTPESIALWEVRYPEYLADRGS